MLTLCSGFEAKTLQDYRDLMPKKWPDLQQYPCNGRGRGECKDGALQTLTTNSTSIFSEERCGLDCTKNPNGVLLISYIAMSLN
jgi:hypothetical protein